MAQSTAQRSDTAQPGRATVDGCAKAPKSGEHKMWGLTSWNGVFSQTGR